MRKVKGVSPIISVLLLIVIAVAAAVVTYGFVMGFIGGTTTTTTTTQARIMVEGVKYDSNSKQLTVYVRNVGTIPTTPDVAYVYYANESGIAAQITNQSTSPIKPGETAIIESSASLKPEEYYYVKVTTQEGAQATSEVFYVP